MRTKNTTDCIIDKLEEGGHYTVELTEELVDKYCISPKLIDSLNQNKYRISLLFQSILESRGITISEDKIDEFVFLNNILPLFISYADEIIDVKRDETLIKNLVLSIQYGKKHASSIVKVMSKLSMENSSLRDSLIATYKSNKEKKNARNIFSYIRTASEEGMSCALAQIDILEDFQLPYEDLKPFILIGILDSLKDDLLDFDEDYRTGEIKLKPNFIRKAIFKSYVKRYENRIARDYPEEYKILCQWDMFKYRHKYEFKI